MPVVLGRGGHGGKSKAVISLVGTRALLEAQDSER